MQVLMITNIVAIDSVLRLLAAFSIVVLCLKNIFWGIGEVALLLIVSVLMIAGFYNFVRFEGFLKFDLKGIPH
jgi:ABC-type uncharacterized transport system permease subunit